MRKKFLILCLTLMCFLMPCVSACNNSAPSSIPPDNEQTEPFNPVLNEVNIEIGVDQTFQLQVLDNTENLHVEWVSLDSSIVSVTNGLVVGNKIGSTTIRAMVGEKRLACKVTVKLQEQLLLQLVLKNETSQDGVYRLNLLKGDTYTLTPALMSKTEIQEVTFNVTTENAALSVHNGSVTGNAVVENSIVKVSCTYENKTYEIDVFVSVYEEV